MRPRPGSHPTRIVIVDDHALSRVGLRSLLRGARDLEVIGEAGSGLEAVALCRRVLPDLVLMDFELGDMDGLAAIRAIRAARPSTVVLVISMHDAPVYLVEATRAGAAGYVLKGASRYEVLVALRQARDGFSVAGSLYRH
jgi:DNA-binding NarL/FixJ family response regulator